MDGKVVRKLREDHKRILGERYGGVDCLRLDNRAERTRIRVYLAYMWQIWRSDQKLSRYVWQSHPENGSARKIAHFGSWPSMAR